jgi:uncharacterized protein (DUF1501 family)
MPPYCNEFGRAEFLRHAVAEAGRGLPTIERGMPTPAGTGMSRRTFVVRSAGLALSVYGASKLGIGAFDAGVADAAEAAPSSPVLVSIFLPGGLDSMSLLAPVGDPKYASLRPTLKLDAASTQAFSEDTRLHWHPAADGLRTLHAEGKVTVFPAIGYDHPNQSHFTSRHFWEVGALDTEARYGWLGRYLDRVGDAHNPLQGLCLDDSLSPALAARDVPVAAVADPAGYDFWAPGVGDPVSGPMLKAIGDLGRLPADGAALATARSVAASVDQLRTQMAPFQGQKPSGPVAYPSSDFARKLQWLGTMLGSGLPLRCVAVNAPGQWDTHSGQTATLDRNLKMTFDALLAFQRDLEARGLDRRVLVNVWSEFGRRPKENGGGTDHGAAGCAFVIGTRASGRMVGEFPGLATLDPDQNLRATSDFRGLYCSLLEQWLGADAGGIVPGASSLIRPTIVN